MGPQSAFHSTELGSMEEWPEEAVAYREKCKSTFRGCQKPYGKFTRHVKKKRSSGQMGLKLNFLAIEKNAMSRLKSLGEG